MIALKMALTVLVVWFSLFIISERNANALRKVRPEVLRKLEAISACLVVLLIISSLVLIWIDI